MRNWLAALFLILALLPGLVQAQTYRWVDEAGTVHYTQGIGSIPERYRSQARPLAIDPPPSSPALAEKPPPSSPPFAPSERPPSSRPPSPTATREPSGPLREITRISFPPGSHILVSAKINGQGPVTLLLDTSPPAWTMVTAQALRRLGISTTNAAYRTVERIGRKVGVRLVPVTSVEVGKAKVGPLQIDAFDEADLADLARQADGILGVDFLSHFTVTINPREGVVTLTATTDPRKRVVTQEGPPNQPQLWAMAVAVLVGLGVWALQMVRRRRQSWAYLLRRREKGFSALVGRIRKALSPESPDRTLVQHPGTLGPPGRQGHLKCPQCSARLTKLDTGEGIEVHWCQSCNGTWHDKGILDEFSRESGLPELLQEKPVFSHPSDRRCPRCDVPMEKSGLGAVKFLVNRCRSCQGLWLDHGETANAGGGRR